MIISGHGPGPSGFPHTVLAPAPPGALAHSFEQMRDSLPRPPFSGPHIGSAGPG